jgi:ribonuclease HI
MIVLITDGSSKGNPGPIQIGYLIWDRIKNNNGFKPTYRKSLWRGAGTNNEAEWMAMNEGLKFIRDNMLNSPGLHEIQAYCDSQVVVRQINGEYQARHENIVPYYQEFLMILKGLASSNCKLTVSWLPRQLTQLADKEAHRCELATI